MFDAMGRALPTEVAVVSFSALRRLARASVVLSVAVGLDGCGGAASQTSVTEIQDGNAGADAASAADSEGGGPDATTAVDGEVDSNARDESRASDSGGQDGMADQGQIGDAISDVDATLLADSGADGALDSSLDCDALGTADAFDASADVNGSDDADAETREAGDAWVPPTTELYTCPADQVRVHVRDMWSDIAFNSGEPSLNDIVGRPFVVNLFDPDESWNEFAAREDTQGCDWYSGCVPPTTKLVVLEAMGDSNGCTASARSGAFSLATVASTSADVWLSYGGSNSSLPSDYEKATVDAGAFQWMPSGAGVPNPLCSADAGPPTSPSGGIQVHIRWPWGDPSSTGFPGTDCEKLRLGFDTPPYPTSIAVVGAIGCGDIEATLDFQDNDCPWYTLVLPTSQWSLIAPTIEFAYPRSMALSTANITLPALSAISASGEVWVSYVGPVDSDLAFGTACMNYSTRSDMYQVDSFNPGPAYPHCGSGGPAGDP